MNIIERLLEITGKGRLLRGTVGQPNDLMKIVKRVHERTFYRLTGKMPLSLTIGNKVEVKIESQSSKLSPVRRLARRGL